LTEKPPCDPIDLVSKKRPREPGPLLRVGARTARVRHSAGGRRRPGVFRNFYTYRGRRVAVNHWSIKIQHGGIRRTISLVAKSRAAAAIEARAIVQTVLTQGWDAVAPPQPRRGVGFSPRAGTPAESLPKTDPRYWKRRLLRRRHAFPTEPALRGGLSARIEHAGSNHYFPLGTTDEETAAVRAQAVYLTVIKEGWEAVHQRFSREVTVGIHWTDNPVAWTYSTIHTLVRSPLRKAGLIASRPVEPLKVAVVEPDSGVRCALWRSIDNQPGFACTATYSTAREAFADMGRNTPNLALLNVNSTDLATAELADQMPRCSPELPIRWFTTHEDSDQLFKATPGGASGYLLKRTSPDCLFEPILGVLEDRDLSADRIALHVRRYFQSLVESLSTIQPTRDLARLTHREHDILSLLSKGYLDKEIAGALGISLWTVHGHLKKVYEKLGAHTRTEAAVRYLQK